MTVNLPDALFEKSATIAARRGETVEQLVIQAVQRQVDTDAHKVEGSIAHLQQTDPEEWVRQFRAWVNSHDSNLPVLSDEAMSRDSIYPDRS